MLTAEDGDDTFSETSVQASATRYQVQEDILNLALILLRQDRLCGLVVTVPAC
jgi:hypothetical protein